MTAIGVASNKSRTFATAPGESAAGRTEGLGKVELLV
jgi:hypothetical protein